VTAATLDQARGLANGDCQLYDVVAALEARRQQIEDCYAGGIIPWATYARWLRARGVARLVRAASDELWWALWGRP
jgi:hypothetical protein